MIYGAQGTGKGKSHLIPHNAEGDELCGYNGGLHSSYNEYETINGELFELDGNNKIVQSQFELTLFCQKCLKKAGVIFVKQPISIRDKIKILKRKINKIKRYESKH